MRSSRLAFSHRRAYHEALRKVAATGDSAELEHIVPYPDGQCRIHHVRLVAEYDVEGMRTGVLAIGRDITEVRRAEEALRAQEQEFRSLADNAPDNIIRYDRECRILFANRNLMMRVNLPVAPEVGKRSQDISWGQSLKEEKERYRTTLERVIKTGNAETVELLMGGPGEQAEPRLHHIKIVAERDQDQQIKGALDVFFDQG